MKSIDEIPNDWDTDRVEVVTINPHTGEVQEGLSSTGAGPQEDQVRGLIEEKPCSECEDGRLRFLAPEGVLECPSCMHQEQPEIQHNEHA